MLEIYLDVLVVIEVRVLNHNGRGSKIFSIFPRNLMEGNILMEIR